METSKRYAKSYRDMKVGDLVTLTDHGRSEFSFADGHGVYIVMNTELQCYMVGYQMDFGCYSMWQVKDVDSGYIRTIEPRYLEEYISPEHVGPIEWCFNNEFQISYHEDDRYGYVTMTKNRLPEIGNRRGQSPKKHARRIYESLLKGECMDLFGDYDWYGKPWDGRSRSDYGKSVESILSEINFEDKYLRRKVWENPLYAAGYDSNKKYEEFKESDELIKEASKQRQVNNVWKLIEKLGLMSEF